MKTTLSELTPLVGVSCCLRDIGGVPYHTVFDKYVRSLAMFSGCDSVLVPALGSSTRGGLLNLRSLLTRLDGFLLTGSRTMVAPRFYNGPPNIHDVLEDSARDETTLEIVRLCVEMHVPIFAICRGLQELCCALGGSLNQAVHEAPGAIDHRAQREVEYVERYRPSHNVHICKGGILSRLTAVLGLGDSFEVNSLHVQGIETTGDQLFVEARAPDGLVEAVSVPSSPVFSLGVQWHPEWYVEDHPLHKAAFEEFGRACAERLRGRVIKGGK